MSRKQNSYVLKTHNHIKASITCQNQSTNGQVRSKDEPRKTQVTYHLKITQLIDYRLRVKSENRDRDTNTNELH